MDPLFSIKIANYKCFGAEPQGIDKLLPINLIIGRNNSGKSTIIDLVKFFMAGEIPRNPALEHRGAKPEITITSALTEGELKAIFPEGKSGGGIPARSWWEYGKAWVGKPLKWKLTEKRKALFR